MDDLILAARGLTYAYPGGVLALDGLDMAVPRGQRLAILGANGAGKTTLLLHLNGTLAAKSGHVLLNGQVMGHGRADLVQWRRQVGLVLQDPDDQLFAGTVFEDVSFGPLNLGLDPAQAEQRTRDALDRLGIAHLADRPPHMLSFGQKKRVAIAGAVAMQPRVLLLDEPTAGLDGDGAALLLSALDALHAKGTTLVFTTHDADLAWAWADRVALFGSGKVGCQGDPATVMSNAQAMDAARLTPPLALELGMLARTLGHLPNHADLPRTRSQTITLMRACLDRS